jgi:prefoldin beta subunit
MANNQEDINELSRIENSSHHLLSQRQAFQAQLSEVESALIEMESSENIYKIIGHIMVLSKKEKIKNELLEKKEMLDIRIKSILKQENKLKEKADDLRNKVIGNIKE